MFSDVTVNPGVSSGLHRDVRVTGAMQRLAQLRNRRKPLDKSATSDVHAAFKEGERSPVREAGGMST